MTGIERIAAERQRQIFEEGWVPSHDDDHDRGELVMAAIAYASHLPVQVNFDPEGKMWDDPWPWDAKWDKRHKHSRIRQLEIAGALIAAEIDRLQRFLGRNRSATTEHGDGRVGTQNTVATEQEP